KGRLANRRRDPAVRPVAPETRVTPSSPVVYDSIFLEPPGTRWVLSVDFEDASPCSAIRTEAHADIARCFDAAILAVGHPTLVRSLRAWIWAVRSWVVSEGNGEPSRVPFA